MKLKHALLLPVAVLGMMLMLAAPASAAYVKAEVGFTADTQVDTSYGSIELGDDATYGAYVGTAVGPFRVEGGVAHISGDANFYGLTVDASANDFNATAYLDTASGFYVGAGVNYIQAEATPYPGYSIEQSGYGWHVSGGYAFAAFGGIVETQVTYLDASLDDFDLTQTRATIGYRHAI